MLEALGDRLELVGHKFLKEGSVNHATALVTGKVNVLVYASTAHGGDISPSGASRHLEKI